MCARFVIKTPASEIASEFRVQEIFMDLLPSYNVAPTQKVPVVLDDGVYKLISCRWGLVPPWAKDMSFASRMINARAETVAEKPSFKKPFRNSRCLVVADGFFEWRKSGDRKIPVYITMKDEKPFGFAGLTSNWNSPEGEDICTCSIITTEPNSLLKAIHDRMPVIIDPGDRDGWLDPDLKDNEALLPMLKPFDPELMTAWEVSTEVNSPRNNSPDNIMPVE